MPTPGRNDPCPCGSGRKYKHCCLRAADAEDAARTRLRTAEGVLVPALFAFANEEWGDGFFDEAWEEFFAGADVPEQVEESREFGTTFDPFFVFSFVPDPAHGELPEGWPTEPVALHFLHHEVESCPDSQREFIEQACRSHPSFFVVEATVPGRSIDLKDVLTGRRFHVLEQSASQTFQSGDLTYTRVVTAGGASIMIGAAPWIIPPAWHVRILEFRDMLRPRGPMPREDLRTHGAEIRRFYHGIVDALLHPAPPQLSNTDGDPIEMTTMTYALTMPVAEALERLRPLATIRGEAHVDDETLDESGALTSAVLTWIKAGNRQHKDWDNTILGTLRLEASRFVVDVNSARRREKIAKEIAKRLGPAATLIDTTVTDPIEAMTTRRAARAGGGAPAPAELPELPRTPEIEALEAELARKHWDSWIDTKIPALGNRTPRQAARTALGRERLGALLIDYARSAERAPSAFRPDVAELRSRLGLV